MSNETVSTVSTVINVHAPWVDAMALKVIVTVLAVAFIAAPVAYGAYLINAVAEPVGGVWLWPVFAVLAAVVVALCWWAVQSLHRKFPYS
ncbi:MAG: hypothetical protein LC772_02615 [Chloroflexi bacterium]|nr:hypothetical protein [Chloroflexota bacterium]